MIIGDTYYYYLVVIVFFCIIRTSYCYFLGCKHILKTGIHLFLPSRAASLLPLLTGPERVSVNG